MHMHTTAYASSAARASLIERLRAALDTLLLAQYVQATDREPCASTSTWSCYQQSSHASGISNLLPAFGQRVLDQLQSDSDLDALALALIVLLPHQV